MIFWSQIQYFISTFSTVSILFMLGMLPGILIGINVPDGAGCTNHNFLCDKLRLRQPKVNIGG